MRLELTKKYNRHLLLEPLKGAYPETLEEVVKLQEKFCLMARISTVT